MPTQNGARSRAWRAVVAIPVLLAGSATSAGEASTVLRCQTTDTWVVKGRVDGRTQADFGLALDLPGLRYRYDHWQPSRFAAIDRIEGDTITLYRHDIRFATLQTLTGQYKAMSVASGVELFSQGFCKPAVSGH